MAAGDIIWFDEAMALDFFVDWSGTDDIKCAILDNTVAPTAASTSPQLGDFTEVGTGGTYVAGGTSLGTWATINSQTAGAGLVDSATNPTWAANAGNDVDAYWGLLYNDTIIGKLAFAYVDLGGPIDMTAGALTITWNPSGIATITKV